MDAGRVEGDEDHFTGDVRVRPFTEVVRTFWDQVGFSETPCDATAGTQTLYPSAP